MNRQNPVILCVDDQEANLKLLEKLLVPRGYTVVKAASGQDALLQINSQAVDLVLLDVIMPGMDGFEVCRQIKKDPKLRSIPVIMVTALTAKEDRILGIEAGAEEFLSKPFDLAEVLARIRILLKMKELDDDRQSAEKALQKSHAELEDKVRERTRELIKANEMLQADIIERKRAGDALMKSEKKFRDIFENVLDAYYETAIDGTILEISPSIEIMSKGQYHRDELIGKSMKDFYSDSVIRQSLMDTLQERGKVLDYEIKLKNRDGSLIPCAISSRIHFDAHGRPEKILGTIRDITERKRAEEKIKNSLLEKEVLLKEVHHRVKNNLMTIIGLLKMQETKANNEMFNPLLQELESRVRAMALVHEGLHKSDDLAHIHLQNYIETMGAQICAQFGAERDIRFAVQAAGVDVGLDIAVPCGLILNELITNACKHAFPGGKPRSGASLCEISISIAKEDGTLILTVANNGVDLPDEVNWKNPETVGLQLIKMLSKQINGSIEVDRSSGTVFSLKFPVTVT
jgi:PAS domain S-box-containing protein